MKVFSAIIKAQEIRTRREVLIQLRAMTDRALIDCNFSPELVKEGINAWPWENPPQELGRLKFEHVSPACAAQAVEKSVSMTTTTTTVEHEQSVELAQIERPVQVAQRNAA